ncbi:MAG: hypothetical protein AXW11_14710 [Marinobacter sp. Hex_13]|nr:MAG: hypothetical protein AXW11_14710 [Marinobacter sp. Hex_13]
MAKNAAGHSDHPQPSGRVAQSWLYATARKILVLTPLLNTLDRTLRFYRRGHGNVIDNVLV